MKLDKSITPVVAVLLITDYIYTESCGVLWITGWHALTKVPEAVDSLDTQNICIFMLLRIILLIICGDNSRQKMSIEQAKSIGQKETLKWTPYIFLVCELVAMLIETSGDFANGIIFFIAQHMNIHYLIMVAILFTVTNMVGSKNGKEILIIISSTRSSITFFNEGLAIVRVKSFIIVILSPISSLGIST